MSCSYIRKKLPAFTLLELITGMIVSVLVLAIIFSAYHIVSRQAARFGSRTAMKRELSLLHSMFTKDTHSADSVSCVNENETQCFDRHGTNFRLVTTYVSGDRCVLRKTESGTDTFHTDSVHFNLHLPHAGDQH